MCERTIGENFASVRSDSAALRLQSVLQVLFFMQVEINEKALRNIYIANNGRFNLDYAWEGLPDGGAAGGAGKRGASAAVDVTPRAGAVTCGDRTACQLIYVPTAKGTLKGCNLTLKVRLHKSHI